MSGKSIVSSRNATRVKGLKYVGTLADGEVWVFQLSSGNMIPGSGGGGGGATEVGAGTDSLQQSGVGANASGIEAIALGKGAVAQGNSTAIGDTSAVNALNGVAVGTSAIVAGNNSVAVGDRATTSASATQSVAVGVLTNVTGLSGVAIGYSAGATGDNAVSIGHNSDATFPNSLAVGVTSQATANNAVALGDRSTASAGQATALGALAVAGGVRSLALGIFMNASADDSIMIGGSTITKTNATSSSLEVNFNEATSTIRIAKAADSWINTTANIGIGLNSGISAKFHIKGSGITSGTTALLVQNNSSINLLEVKDDGTSLFSGLVGVGKAAPIFNVHIEDVESSNLGLKIESSTTSRACTISTGGEIRLFNTGATNVVKISEATHSFFNTGANFGFGISTPTYKVHIQEPPSSLKGLLINNTSDSRSTIINSVGGIFQNNGAGVRVTDLNSYSASYFNSGFGYAFGHTVPLARIHIKGTGITSGTTALLVQNNSGTNLLEVKDDGTILGNLPNVSDGDYGDVTVSSSGTVWTVDDEAITLAKMQHIATAKILGRGTAGTGDVEELATSGDLQILLGVLGLNTTPMYISDVTTVNLLDDLANWTSGNYTGTAITGTFQGQKHVNSTYLFHCTHDNIWVRILRA